MRSTSRSVEKLEDRALLSTLDVTGSTLTYTLDSNSVDQSVTSPFQDQLTFNAGAGTITLTGSAASYGFTTGGATSTGDLDSFAPTITTVNIVGAAGTELFSISTIDLTVADLDVAASVETTSLDGTIGTTSSHTQTYNSAETWIVNTDGDLTASTVTFTGAIKGDTGSTTAANSHALNVTGNAVFSGATADVSSLVITGTTSITGTDITTNAGNSGTGAQSYTSGVTVSGTIALTTGPTGANIDFQSTLSGASDLSTTTTGFVTFGGTVGGTALTSLTTSGVGGTTRFNTNSVTTTGNQTYNNNVSLIAVGATTFTANSGTASLVQFAGTLSGNSAALNFGGADTNVEFDDAVTSVTNLTISGTTALNVTSNPAVSTTGTQTYTGGVTLQKDTTLQSTGVAAAGNVTFTSTVTGAFALAVNTAGTTLFGGVVGTAALTSLTTDAAGTTRINSNVTTTGVQTYNDALVIGGAAVTLASTAGGNDISFNSTVDGIAAGTNALTVNTTGDTVFTSAVGTNVSLLSLATNAGGATQIQGGAVTTSTSQTYGDTLTIESQDATLTGGVIGFSSTVDGPFALIVSGTTVTFDGDVGATTELDALTVTGTTAINFNVNANNTTSVVNTVNGQTFNNAVTIGGTGTGTVGVAFTSSGDLDIAFGAALTDDAGATEHAVTVNTAGVTTLTGAVGGTALASLTTNSGGSTVINGGAVATSGIQSYGDDVTLGATTSFTATTATFNGTVTGGGFSLTAAGSSNVDFEKAVSGVLNLSVGGTTRIAVTSGTAISTSGTQTYTGAVTLAANTTIESTGGNDITFVATTGTINSDSTLTPRTLAVNTTGTTIFGGVIGGTAELQSLTTDTGGTTQISTTGVNTTQTQTYNDAVVIAADTTLASSGGQSITFISTVNSLTAGSNSLAVNTAGSTIFSSTVGATFELTTLTTDAGGTTEVKGNVTTSGAQTFNDNVALTGVGAVRFLANATPTADGGAAALVRFAGTLTGNSDDLAFGSASAPNAPTNVRFDDAVSSVVDLLVTGTTVFGNASAVSVTTTGTQTYTGVVTMNQNVTLDATAGQLILFSSTITGGGFSLTIGDTNNSDVEFDGTVGATAAGRLSSVSVLGTTTFGSAAAITVFTTGVQSYAGAASLVQNTTLDASGASGDVTLGSTVDSAANRNLTVTLGDGNLTFEGAVGTTNALGVLSITANAAGGVTTINGGAVTTTSTQGYGDDVVLGADTTITGTTATFSRTVDGGTFSLALATSTNAVFNDAVSNVANVSVAGTTNFNSTSGTTVSSTGTQSYTGIVTLTQNTVLTSSGGGASGDITFTAAVNSVATDRSLVVNTAGTTTFGGAVGGGGNDLLSLTTDATGATAINGGAVTTSAAQAYGDAVTIGADTTLTGTTITFSTTLRDDGTAADSNLIVTASGVTTFAGAVGDNSLPLTSLTTNGGSTTRINGGSVTTTAAQLYTDDVTLGADTTLTGTDVTFSGTLEDDQTVATSNLTIDASGTTLFSGAVGGTTATTALTSLTTNAAGATTINANVTTTGDQTYGDDVTLTGGAKVFIANSTPDTAGGTTGLVKFSDTLTGIPQDVTFGQVSGPNVPTNVEFDAAVSTILNLIVTGTSQIDGGSVSTSATQTYIGAVTLGANTAITATTVTFESTVSGTGFSLSTSNAAEFEADVGSLGNELSAVTVTGTTAFGNAAAIAVHTTGNQTYTGAATLNQNTTLDSAAGDGDITFSNTVNSATGTNRNLTVLTGAGDLTFTGTVGATDALGVLTVTGTGTANINGGSVRSSGNQTYNIAVALGFAGATTFVAESSPGATVGTAQLITFGGTLTGNTNNVNIGVAVTDITNVEFDGAVSVVVSLLVTGTTNFAVGTGTAVTSTGTQTYTGATTISENTTLVSSALGAGGNITFSSTVNDSSAGTHTLTVNTSGTTTFTGAVGGTALASLTTNAGGTTRINGGSVVTTGDQTYGDNVILNAGTATTFTANTGTDASLVTFSGTLSGTVGNLQNLNIGGSTTNVEFDGSVSNVDSLTVTGTTAVLVGASSSLLSASITSANLQTYTGAVTLASGKSITFRNTTANGIIFGSTVDGAADLIADTLAGQTTIFSDVVGSVTALKSLTVKTGLTNLAASGTSATPTVSTTNGQKYANNVVLGATPSYLKDATSNIEFDGTLVSASVALTVDAANAAIFKSTVTLASLTVTNATQLTGTFNVTTASGQLYGGAVTLSTGPFTLSNSNAGSTIEFDGTISGAAALTVTTEASAIALFKGSIGASPLNSLTITNASEFDGATSITTSGAQSYGGAVTIDNDLAASSNSGGIISFASTIDGTFALIVTTTNNISFGGDIGGTSPLTSLTATGTGGLVQFGASADAVTTTGAQTYGKDVTVATTGTQNFTANSSPGNTGVGALVKFSGTLTRVGASAPVLELGATDSPTNVEFDGDVGVTGTRFSTVTVSGTSKFAGSGTRTVFSTGAQTYTGAARLNTATTVDANTAAAITFSNTINGSFALVVNTTGATTFGGAVGSSITLASLTTNTGGTTAINGGVVKTSGAQLYGEDVSLGADTVLTASGVTFTGTVTGGGFALTASGSTNVEFDGAVTTVTDLSIGGTTNFASTSGTSVSTTGSQTYTGAATLTQNTVLVSTGGSANGDVVFGSTVNSVATDRSLSVTTGGTTRFGGAVGGSAGTTELLSLTTDAAGATEINGGTVRTSGAQTYNDATSLGANTTLLSSGNANVTFASTLDSLSSGVFSLTVNTAGSSLSTFSGAVGDNYALYSVTTNAGGTTQINGGIVTTTSTQSYGDTVTISANAVITSTGLGSTGNITFTGTVDSNNATPKSLTVNTSGTTTFSSAVGGTNSLTSLTTDATGTTAINGGSVITTGDQTYNDNVTYSGAVQFTANSTGAPAGASLVAFAGTLVGNSTNATFGTAGTDVTNVEFNGSVSGVAALLVTGTTSLLANATSVTTASITTSSTQTYSGAVTLTTGTTITARSTGGSAILFSSTVSGSADLIVDTTGLTTFTGRVGASALDSLWVKSGAATLSFAGSALTPTVTTTGGQKYAGAVTLGSAASAYFTDTASTIEFSSTVAGTGSTTVLTIDAFGLTSLLGNVGTIKSLTVVGDVRLGADNTGTFTGVTTTSTSATGQSYGGTVTLGLGKTITLTDNGSTGQIVFNDTVNGRATLTATTAAGVNKTIFKGDVGATPLVALTVTNNVDFNGAGSVTTSGAQTYARNVVLFNDLAVASTNGGAISFSTTSSTINGSGGAFDLTVSTTSTVTFAGTVGVTTPLATLTTSGTGGTTAINTTAIRTTGNQTYGNNVTVTGATTLSANSTLAAGGSAALVTFAGTLTGNSNSITFGSGASIPTDVAFNGAVSGFTSLSVGGETTITVSSGTAITTTAAQTYTGDVTLGAATVLSSGSTILFSSTVDSAASTNFGLTITATTSTTFSSDVGSDNALGSLAVTGLAILGPGGATAIGVNTTTTQTYNSAVNVASNATLTSTGILASGNITFSSTVNDSAAATHSLLVQTKGITTFTGVVGGTARLASLETDAGAGSAEATIIRTNVTTSGAQTYGDAVIIGTGSAATVLLTSNTGAGVSGAITFGSTVDDFTATNSGKSTLSIAASGTGGTVEFDGRVGSIKSLAALTISAAAGTTFNTDLVLTTTTQTYTGAVTVSDGGTGVQFGAGTTSASTVTFNSTLTESNGGVRIGYVPATGSKVVSNAVFNGDVSAISLIVSGTTTINTAAITTSSGQQYVGAVTLSAATIDLTDTTGISFASTINGTSNLTVNGPATFAGNVGLGTPLTTLHATSPTTLGDANRPTTPVTIRTTGTQTYDDATGLASDVVLLAGTNLVLFQQTVVNNATTPKSLTIGSSTVATDVRFEGDVGASGDELNKVTVWGDVTFGAVSGTPSVTVSSTGVQDYKLTGTLNAETTLDTSAGGANVLFGGAISSVGFAGLTVNLGVGSAAFGGKLGAVGAELGQLTITGTTGATNLNMAAGTGGAPSVATTGAQSYGNAVRMLNNTVLTGSLMTFSSTVDSSSSTARSLDITGDASFGGNVGAKFALSSLTVSGNSTIGAAVIRTSGLQTFTGAVTLQQNTALTSSGGGAIGFGSTVDSGVDGSGNRFSLTVNTSGATTFGGAVGGSAFGALASLATNAGGTTTINGGAVTTTGTQSFGDAVTLGADTQFTAGTSASPQLVRFYSTVAAATFDLTVGTPSTDSDIESNAEFDGSVSAADVLTVYGATAFGSTTGSTAVTIGSTGDQTYWLAVTLNQNATLNTAGGDLEFKSTVNSLASKGKSLTIDAGGGNVTFQAAVGQATNGYLNTLSIAANAGLTSINGGFVTSKGTQTYGQAVSLGANTLIVSGTALVTFQDTVTGNSTRSLQIGDATRASNVEFDDNVTGLTTLTVYGTTQFGLTNTPLLVTSSGKQEYKKAATLVQDTTLTTSSANVVFGGTVNGGLDLTVNAGAGGDISFAAAVGGTTSLSDVTITNANDVTFASTVSGASLMQSAGTGTTTLAKAVTASGTGGVSLTTAIVNVNGTITASDAAGAVAFATTGLLTIAPGANITAGGNVTKTGAGLVRLGGNISTGNNGGDGAISINTAVTLTKTVTLSTTSSASAQDITFGSTVNSLSNGSFGLTANSAGATTFTGAVGGSTNQALAFLTTDADLTGSVSLVNVTTTGAQTYGDDTVTLGGTAYTTSTGAFTITAGDVTLANSATVNAGGNITFGATAGTGTVTVATSGTRSLTLNTSRTTTLNGDVGTTALRLLSLTTDAAGTTALGNTTTMNIFTSAAQTFNDKVTLATDTTLTGTTVSFGNSITGSTDALTITGNAVLGGSSSNTVTGLTTLTISGSTVINARSITSTDDQTYGDGTGTDSVTLGATVTLTTANMVTFSSTSTVNSASTGTFGLTVNATDVTTFGAAVGSVRALASLVTNAAGGTVINGGVVTTTGAQTYGDDVTIGGNNLVVTSSGGSAITFNGTVADDGGAAQSLTVNTTGNTIFVGAVGGTPLASLTTNAGGTTQIKGGAVTTTGAQTYNDAVTITVAASTAFASNTSGAITFAQAITAVGRDVSISTNSGNIALNSVAGTTQLGAGDLTLSLGGTGSATQGSASSIRASGLELLGASTGTYTLSSTTNHISTLAGSFGGNITYTDSAGFVVGTVNTSGLTATGNVILTAARAVTQTDPIVASSLQLLGAGPFTLDDLGNNVATLLGTVTGNVTFVDSNTFAVTGLSAASVALTGTTITVNGAISQTSERGTTVLTGNVDLNSAISAKGAVTLTGATINLGSNISTTGDAILLDGVVELDPATTSTLLTTGGFAGGNVTFNNTLDSTGTKNLTITAGTGSVLFAADVGATDALGAVLINSAKDVTLTGEFAGDSFTQSAGTGTTTIGTVVGDTFATTGASGVSITTKNVTINGAVSTGNGPLSITNTGTVTVNAGISTTSATGDVSINKSGTAARLVLASGAGITTTGGDVTITEPGSLTANVIISTGPGVITYGNALTDILAVSTFLLDLRSTSSASIAGTVTIAATGALSKTSNGTIPTALSISGAVTGSGTIAGTGTVTGLVTIASGGKFAPGVQGSSPVQGTFSLSAATSTFTTATGGLFNVQLISAGVFDSLDANGGSVTLGSGVSTLNVTLKPGFVPAVGSSFAIISGAGSVSGTFAGKPENATFNVGNLTFRINYTASAVTLTRVTVPTAANANILDDRDGSSLTNKTFATSSSTPGVWQSNTSQAGAYNQESLVASQGSAADFVTWTFTGLTSGASYRISTTWAAIANGATNAQFELTGGTLTTVSVNQRLSPAGFVENDGGTNSLITWQDLSSSYTISGTTLTVKLYRNATTGSVVADAVRIQPTALALPVSAVDVTDTYGPLASSTNVANGFTANFGDVLSSAPTSLTKTITITNSGPAGSSLVLGTLSPLPAGFTTTYTPRSVASGASTSFTITLNKNAPIGSYSGAFTIATNENSATRNPFTINLVGAVSSGAILDNSVPASSTFQFIKPAGTTGTITGTYSGSGTAGSAAGFLNNSQTTTSATVTWTFSGADLDNNTQYALYATWQGTSAGAYSITTGTVVGSAPSVTQSASPNDITDGGRSFEYLGTFKPVGNTIVVTLTGVGANADAIRLTSVPQLAPQGQNAPNSTAAALTTAQLQPVVTEALSQLADTALGQAYAGALSSTKFAITDLPAGFLGTYDGATSTIYIDQDAAGYGWYVDTSAAAFTSQTASHEFVAAAGSSAYGKMDLLTVLEHELGHVLGFGSGGAANSLMSLTLETGTRRSPGSEFGGSVASGSAATGGEAIGHLSAEPVIQKETAASGGDSGSSAGDSAPTGNASTPGTGSVSSLGSWSGPTVVTVQTPAAPVARMPSTESRRSVNPQFGFTANTGSQATNAASTPVIAVENHTSGSPSVMDTATDTDGNSTTVIGRVSRSRTVVEQGDVSHDSLDQLFSEWTGEEFSGRA